MHFRRSFSETSSVLTFVLLAWTALSLRTALAQNQMVQLTRLGGVSSIRNVQDLFQAENYLYICTLAEGQNGLLIVDVTDAANPQIVGRFETPRPIAVIVRDHHAFVIDEYEGLKIIDVSDPTRARRVAGDENKDLQFASALELNGNFAYVTVPWMQYVSNGILINRPAGVVPFDVSDPLSPRRFAIEYFPTNFPAPPILAPAETSGTFSYVPFGDAIRIYDIGYPDRPRTLVASYHTGFPNSSIYGVASAGSMLYVGHRNIGLEILDVSEPLRPRHLSRFDTPGYGTSLVASSNLVFIAKGELPLIAIDVSDPEHPYLAGTYGTRANGSYGVALSGNQLYLAESQGLSILGIRYGLPQAIDLALPRDLFLPGSPYPLNALASSGLPITYSVVSGPAVFENNNLILTNTGKVTIRLTQAGNDQYLPVTEERDLNSATVSLTLVGSALFPPLERRRNVRSVFLSGNKAYVGSHGGWSSGAPSFTIFDVSDPSAPRLLADHPDYPGYPQLLAVSGDYAYFSAGKNLQIIRISDPTKAELVATYETGLYPLRQVFLSKDVAFLGDDAKVEIVDVKNPVAPARLSFLEYASGLQAAVSGDYLYTSYKIFDVTDPSNPVQLPNTFRGGDGLTVLGDLALFTRPDFNTGSYRFTTLDLSDKTAPKEIGATDLPFYSRAMTVSGNYAFMSGFCAGFGGCDGVQIVDFSQPTNPRWAGAYASRGYTNAVAAVGDYLYVAAGEQGFHVLKINSVTEPKVPVLSVRPDGNFYDVFWPVSWRGFQLQRSSALGSSVSWKDVDTEPTETEGEFRVSVDFSAQGAFFRLVKPVE